MTDGSRRRVALIHHTSTNQTELSHGDLRLFVRLLEDSTDVQHAVVAWDDPRVDWTSFTHFFVTSAIMYVSHFEAFTSWLGRLESSIDGLGERMFNPPAVVRWNSSKRYLKELEAKGVRIPPTVWLDEESDLQAWDPRNSAGLSGQVVVKDTVGESGLGVWKCDLEGGRFPPRARARLQQQLASSSSRHGTMVQAFMEEVLTEGEWSLVFFSGRLSHVVLKTPDREKDFRVQRSYGGRFAPVAAEDVPAGVAAFAEEVLASLAFADPLLYARVDVVRADGKPYLMELEVLDPYLYMTEPEQAKVLFQAFLQATT